MRVLTREQLIQCNFVEITIFNMLKTLIPDIGDDEPEWDQEILAKIMDVIIEHYELDEMAFYPYIEDEDEVSHQILEGIDIESELLEDDDCEVELDKAMDKCRDNNY